LESVTHLGTRSICGPRSYASAHQRDQVENAAHAAICAGKLPLATAQAGFQSDWSVLGQQLGVIK